MSENSELTLSPLVVPPEVSTVDNDGHTLKEQKRLYNERFKTDTQWRCRLSWWVIIVDSVWLAAILLILTFNTSYLQLSDTVLLMLLGTTTINVLGLAFIVLKGLFGVNESHQK